MGGFSGMEEKDYVSLKNLKVELGKVNDGAEEGSGCFSICFWLYIDHCASFPSAILVQKHPDSTSWVPFLCLDDKKKMKLFPLLFVHKDATDHYKFFSGSVDHVASTEVEFPLKKWVHVGCEVLRDLMKLHIDGEIVGEKQLPCLYYKDLHADVLKRIYLACPAENESSLHGYVHGLNVIFPTAPIKNHHVQDPPMQLSIDPSSSSEIEEDSGGVWSIVGGKASCRRIFSLDVTLSDAFGCPVNKGLEVVASLLYADNGSPVENNSDGEPPLFTSFDGIEYASWDRPAKLVNGRASFKLKISQLSSKCESKLFRVIFAIPKLGRYPFLEMLSPPIRCVSRSKNARTPSLALRKSSSRTYYMNGCQSPVVDDRSTELIPSIIREAKPSPSSKRIKLGHDKPFAMFRENSGIADKECDSCAWVRNEDNAHGVSRDRRHENHNGAESNSSASNSSEITKTDPKRAPSVSSPISDLIVFKYCMGGTDERCQLLKEIAFSSSEEEIAYFAEQVSLFSGCLHHRHQIKIAKRLVEKGMQAWTSVSQNRNHVLWENLIVKINEYFLKIACCTRPLTNQDLECLRRISGCQELVSQENFERLWAWLYPVASTLSRSVVSPMWDSSSPLWMEGFITKEKAESILQRPKGLEDPGTFVVRFPTSRSWPHPDAGNLVVTYVGSNSTIHHRLISFDSIDSSSSESVKPLQDLLLEEPELSRLGRMLRSN